MTNSNSKREDGGRARSRVLLAAAFAIYQGGGANLAVADSPPAASEVSRPLPCAGESSGRRYCDNGDGTVFDRRTGLLWLRDASCVDLGPTHDGLGTFDEAQAAAASLHSGRCGLSDGSKAGDWRLPNLSEWKAMLNPLYKNPAIANGAGTAKWRPGDVFFNVRSRAYWSSVADSEVPTHAWGAGLFTGVIASSRKRDEAYIWPVREP